MLHLYFIRHGETDYNALRIVQGGGIDSDLNETGRSQSQLFFEKYKNEGFKQIYCSTLKRTFQTIQPFAENDFSVEKLSGLNELGWGMLEGQPFNEENHRKFIEINRQWSEGNLDVAFENGESPVQVWERANAGLQEIFSAHKNGNILICTHGRTLRIICSMLLGAGLAKMNEFGHDNTGLNLIVKEDSRFIAAKLNSLEHLNRI